MWKHNLKEYEISQRDSLVISSLHFHEFSREFVQIIIIEFEIIVNFVIYTTNLIEFRVIKYTTIEFLKIVPRIQMYVQTSTIYLHTQTMEKKRQVHTRISGLQANVVLISN